ncbi:RDD family protein [Stenoxybacter acetivorans]|uniref:RDD family protein n=1 Tax=Stenoxybacter acetivorans TaxID=422441 RepID=UPI00056B30DE|nr:RDD family protein [Stenoxybacter acetivorans]
MTLPVSLPEPEQELAVELASPSARIGAYVLNMVINFAVVLIFSGVITEGFKYVASRGGDVDAASGWLTLVLLLPIAYGIWQLVWMSQYGQSIGKRIVGIKVISLDGENPGFLSNMLLREVSFNVISLGFLRIVVFLLANLGFEERTWTVSLLGFPLLVCLIMLFRTQTQRRTLQDYLAGTLVVKARKGQ